jgi:hypothetical protein
MLRSVLPSRHTSGNCAVQVADGTIVCCARVPCAVSCGISSLLRYVLLFCVEDWQVAGLCGLELPVMPWIGWEAACNTACTRLLYSAFPLCMILGMFSCGVT